jgi:hypothetical protein
MQCYTIAVLLVCVKWLRCIHLFQVLTHFFVKPLLTYCNSIQNYEYIATFVVGRLFNMHIPLIHRISICSYNVQSQ